MTVAIARTESAFVFFHEQIRFEQLTLSDTARDRVLGSKRDGRRRG